MVMRFANNRRIDGDKITITPVIEDEEGAFVYFKDYQALQTALKEALDGWQLEYHYDHPRIDELRKLLDKEA